MITQELEDLIKIANSLGGFQKNKIVQLCKLIAIKFNNVSERRESILKQQYRESNKFDDWIERLIHITSLHGYTEENIFELSDRFIIWLEQNKTAKMKPNKMNREMLTAMSIEFMMFQLDNAREPNDYGEFRNYLIRNDE